MKAIVCLFAVLACANAGLLVRTPAHDSAVIKSDRLGGNFAYSSVEGHAYAAINPIVQHVPTPVAVSYAAQPIVAPVARQSVVTTHTVSAAHAPIVAAHAAPYVAAHAAPYVAAHAAPYAAVHGASILGAHGGLIY